MDFIQEVGIALDNIYQLALNIKPLMIGLYGILAGSLILNIILIRYMGYGTGQDQDNAAGRIYVALKNGESTPGAISGKFRIMMMSSQDMPISARPVVLDVDLAILASGSTDRGAQIPFPFQDVFLSKDKKFVFYVKSTAAATLTKANCTVNIDITKQLV